MLNQHQKKVRRAARNLNGSRALVIFTAIAFVDKQVKEPNLIKAVKEYRIANAEYEKLVPTN